MQGRRQRNLGWREQYTLDDKLIDGTCACRDVRRVAAVGRLEHVVVDRQAVQDKNCLTVRVQGRRKRRAYQARGCSWRHDVERWRTECVRLPRTKQYGALRWRRGRNDV